MSLAIVFPGQGSQSVGMLAELAAQYPVVGKTFAEASEVLEYDLGSLALKGPEEDLNQTHNTQPAMLAAGVAVWRLWQQQGGAKPAFMAGHSLGEYTALVCAGALDFTDAVALVAERGRYMQEAVATGAGAMAAILGLDDEVLARVCNDAAEGQIVSCANFNAPGQVVIAGQTQAVERAMAAAREAGARRALPLAVSVPSHCALMRPAAERLAQRLAGIAIGQPGIPVLQNVDVAAHDDSGEIAERLAQQLYMPVRWTDTILQLRDQGVDRILEFGPGKVLAGLCKRIDRGLPTQPVCDPQTLDQALNGGARSASGK